MALYWKATAMVMVAVLLGLPLRREQNFALLLSIAACAMASVAAVTYLEPVVTFLRELETLGGLSGDMLGLLLKAVGIGLISQMAGAVCTDAGNAALARQLQLLGSAAVLYLSLPIFSGLLELLQEILGEL